MQPDFSGYATKVGLKCSDGRTILAHAFQNQDKTSVPLVYQHAHDKVENVLGHALLEDRPDGVYAYAFFNDTPSAQHAKKMVQHGDIKMMSIFANHLIERSKNVLHGVIREVSLVLAGANPGALIDNISIQHADGDVTETSDAAVIYTGLEISHADPVDGDVSEDQDNQKDLDDKAVEHADDEKTIQDIYSEMTEEQQRVVHYLVGELANADDDDNAADNDDKDKEDLKQSDTDNHITIDSEGEDDSSEDDESIKHDDTDAQKGTEMTHNVFEDGQAKDDKHVLSHSDLETIKSDAKRFASLGDAVKEYALQHGITDIDTLFPDAKAVDSTPEFLRRRTEWVGTLMSKINSSPFSRIKTLSADLTFDEARAKGYVTGNMKREEWFQVKSRITEPTTVYKKQKLDRDDMIDITDFDVVAWLKGEMRIMLDEEIGRAILVGDGRDISSEDKISEDRIRPIATDHEAYTTVVSVNIDDANSDMNEVLDAVIKNRRHMRGTGQPIMFTSESYIAQFMLLRDGDNRRMYKNLGEIAAELRVAEIVPAEILEEYDDIVAILVNPADYRTGTDKGGNISMFDDFDIDYNQYKYLIETRMSGALTRLKSALVVKKVDVALVLAEPLSPAFNPATSEVTIPSITGVVFQNADTDAVMTAGASPYDIGAGNSITITAVPDTGYYFESSEDDTWTFVSEE